MIVKVLNVWCSLLHFCLLSLVQTTSQLIRIYCCFVFWEKTVVWEKIPKSAVWTPHPAPLANQICCSQVGFTFARVGIVPASVVRLDFTCCTKPTHQVLPESRVDGKAAAESSELCLFRLETPSVNSARPHHKGHISHHKKNILMKMFNFHLLKDAQRWITSFKPCKAELLFKKNHWI